MSQPTSIDPSKEPLELTLKFTRAKHAGDRYRCDFREQEEYIFTHEDGTARNAPFPWSEKIEKALDAVQGEKVDPNAVATLGELLRKFLYDLGFEKKEADIREAIEQRRKVHLTISSNAAELYVLPWERLTVGETGSHLGSQPDCLLRYEWPGTETIRQEPDPPAEGGRILVAWSDAGGEVPSEEHIQAVRDACREGNHPFEERRDVLAGVSLRRLQERLDEAKQSGAITVLHLLCHGGAVDSTQESYGLVWNADGRERDEKKVIDAARLGNVLKKYASSIRLVVLSACHSGNPGELGNHLGSVAQHLHRIGFRAVVASRYPLAVDASIELTRELYRGLLVDSLSLEDAFLKARDVLASGDNERDWASLQLVARANDGPDHRPIVVAPYRGLLAFEEEHERLFFGRTGKDREGKAREVDELVSELEALVEGGKPRLMVVAGDSGTGKASIVLAGAVPRLERQGWVSWVMRPGSRPKEALAQAEAELSKKVAEQAPGSPRPRGLLVVDQFEELLTSGASREEASPEKSSPEETSPEERTEFARRLWELAGPSGTWGVILTLRIDFLGRCGELLLDEKTGLRLDKVACDKDHQVLVAQMDRAQLREAIEEPARKVGLSLDKGLSTAMLDEVRDEPGALPLVQYTLRLLWERRKGRRLTHQAYEALGKVTGALNQHADGVIEGLARTGEAKERVARRLLLSLVRLGDGDGPNTRWRRNLAELRPKEPADFDEVLKALVEQRLLVLSRPGNEQTVEVAHEALIRTWKRLKGWIEEERSTLLALQELRGWLDICKKSGDLLTPRQLTQAQKLLQEHRDAIQENDRRLIEQSEAAAAQRRDRDQQAQLVSQMSSVRELLDRGQVPLASMVLAAVHDPERVRRWSNLAVEMLRRRLPWSTRFHDGKVRSAAWSPDGKRIVTASVDGTARIWLHRSIPELQQALRDATTDCLTPHQRRTYLLETEPEAQRAYEACERSHNRTPASADAQP